MRTLRFIVKDQVITRDPSCNFNGLVPGTDGYLQASFRFSSEWNNTAKVAAFFSTMGKEYEPQALTNGGTCQIPAEALEHRAFKIQIIGKGSDSKKITTNKILVYQDGGKE